MKKPLGKSIVKRQKTDQKYEVEKQTKNMKRQITEEIMWKIRNFTHNQGNEKDANLKVWRGINRPGSIGERVRLKGQVPGIQQVLYGCASPPSSASLRWVLTAESGPPQPPHKAQGSSKTEITAEAAAVPRKKRGILSQKTLIYCGLLDRLFNSESQFPLPQRERTMTFIWACRCHWASKALHDIKSVLMSHC